MSFFKKIFGRTTFDDERTEADLRFEQKEFADARLAYERALDKAATSEEAKAHCEARRDECLDQLALARLSEGEMYLEGGELDLAMTEFENAMELAASEVVKKKARRRMEALEQDDAKAAQEDVPPELDDEDRWTLLVGTFTDAQLEEYDAYGDAFREALLKLHELAADKANIIVTKDSATDERDAARDEEEEGDDREADQAEESAEVRPSPRLRLEALLEEADAPVYLYLEIGRARALDEDLEGAEQAFRAFVDGLDEDEGGEARLGAHAALAALREQAKDEEGALAEFQAALEAFPEDPRAYFMMGRYLHACGHAKEAASVLEEGVALLDEERPDWRYLEELGVALFDAKKRKRAAVYLDRVLTFFVSNRRHDRELDYPPRTAVTRAKIYERSGRFDKAADLYGALANGTDRDNHLLYHREAARLLIEIELFDEARRMLTRALALASGDEAATIEQQLETLE